MRPWGSARKKLLLAALVCSLVLLGATATASAKTPSLKSLAKTVAALQKKVNGQSSTITSQAASIASLSSDLASAKTTIATLQTNLGSLTTIVNGHTQTLATAAPLLAISPYVSLHPETMNGVVGPNIVFQGCNVHVRSSSAEADTSGLGNLIVGWDEDLVSPPTGYRSGSNNLVCGDYNSFYRFGCFLAGEYNIASNILASAYGGLHNTAGGVMSVVAGHYDQANGVYSSISGGENNKASGWASSISGGGGNSASIGLTVSADYGWAAGNTATPGTGTAKFTAP